jgi:hypothetical protein
MRWRILASGERWPIPGWRRSSRGAELDAEAHAARARSNVGWRLHSARPLSPAMTRCWDEKERHGLTQPENPKST